MPAESKGPRLWLKPAGAGGYVWVIKDDGGLRRSTGIRATRRGKAPVEAQDALARYVLEKRTATRVKGRAAGGTKVSDVIAIYMADRTAAQAAPSDAVRRCLVLLQWWGDKLLSDVTIKSCADYVAFRSKPVARRELEDLKAAINYHAALGLHRDVVKVTLPPPGRPRMRWLTRDEAARLIWAAWKFKEVHEAPYRVRYSRRHVARFALIALYTGSRAGAVCAAKLESTRDGGWIDLEAGVFHRRGEDENETNKRRPPVRLSGNLLAHLRRWHRSGQSYAVEWCGKPIGTIEKGFARACADAGLAGVSPHVLRHTAATWQMQAGTPIWEAAGFLGMTTETLESVYGHHHPEFQRSAAENMRRKRPEAPKRSGPASGPPQKEKTR